MTQNNECEVSISNLLSTEFGWKYFPLQWTGMLWSAPTPVLYPASVDDHQLLISLSGKSGIRGKHGDSNLGRGSKQ